MNVKQKVEFLSSIELFSNLSDEEIEVVAKKFILKSFQSGQFLYQETHKRKTLFIIKSGIIELLKIPEPDNEIVVSSYYEGDPLGEGALLDDYPHSTTARCAEDTEVLTLSRSDFSEILDEKPRIGAKILAEITRMISRRLRYTTNRAVGTAAQYISGGTRSEHDLLGDREIPYEAYYGIQTLRALENFNITRVAISHHADFIIALAQTKKACARANYESGDLDKKVFEAIDQACGEIANKRYHTHFVVDLMQGGAGTSTNMNANEVIANRALGLMGYEKGEYQYCHPNNHVNLSQSTNDVYPTAVKIGAYYKHKKMIVILEKLVKSFKNKAFEFKEVIKMGRTQLQDAVPMTLGQEFEAYAVTLDEEINRLNENAKLLLEINMGGTAIGTGLNADKDYKDNVIYYLREITGLHLIGADNMVEATQDTGSFVMYSASLKRLAVKLSKICNDLRLLSSGPRAGFNEINLPAMQPGSSIMPGKVNPVIPEVVNQVAFYVIGNDLTVTLAAEAGQLELNVMEPVIARSIFGTLDMLKNAMNTLSIRCIDGITANEDVCRSYVANSIGIVTALNPVLGYEKSTFVAKEAMKTGRGVYELVLENNLMLKDDLDELLSVKNLIGG
jgi:aspartate ammonia-lyase